MEVDVSRLHHDGSQEAAFEGRGGGVKPVEGENQATYREQTWSESYPFDPIAEFPFEGWYNYFSLVHVKNIFEDLDEWLCRRLRAIIWRQWKRTYNRAKNLMKRGLQEERAWWNTVTSHMNTAFPKRFFDSRGLY